MLMSIDPRYLLDSASGEIPDVKISTSSAEKYPRVGRRWVERGRRKRRALDVKGREKRVRWPGVGSHMVQVQCRARSRGEKK
jgi:hypothetical protein